MKWLQVLLLVFCGILGISGCEEILDEMQAAAEGNNPPPVQPVEHGNLSVSVIEGVPASRSLLPGASEQHVMTLVLQANHHENIEVSSVSIALLGNVLTHQIENISISRAENPDEVIGMSVSAEADGTFLILLNRRVLIVPRGEQVNLAVKLNIIPEADERNFSLCTTEITWIGDDSAHEGNTASDDTCSAEFNVVVGARMNIQISPNLPRQEATGYIPLVCFQVSALYGDIALSQIIGEIWEENEHNFAEGVDLFNSRTGNALQSRAVGDGGEFEFMDDDAILTVQQWTTEEFCLKGLVDHSSAIQTLITHVEFVDQITFEPRLIILDPPLQHNMQVGNPD